MKYLIISFMALLLSTLAPSAGNGEFYKGFSDIEGKRDTFIVLGDTQRTSRWEFWREKNDRERRIILSEIAKRGPAFVIHLGDITARGGSIKHWQDFDSLNVDARWRKIPYFPVLGNHDLYGRRETALENYFDRFPQLENRRWYSFIWRDVAFIMLDSNFSRMTKEQNRHQIEWYMGELRRFERDPAINHVVVCCHEPPYTNSRIVRQNDKVRTYFAEPFMKFRKTVIFFSGHSHSYERFGMADKFFIVSGGGGGPRHEVITDKDKQRMSDQYHGPALRFFHFCEVRSRSTILSVRIVALNDRDEFTIVDRLVIGKVKR